MKEINYRSETLKQDLYDAARRRAWDERLTGVHGAYIIPNGTEHDSEYGCFDIIAYRKKDDDDIEYILCGGGCDDISFEGTHFRMDCMYPSGVIRVWNRQTFSISEDLSSISFEEAN